ncbi:MAG: hypothetical protein IJM87_03475 [Ruminococcus sp.]|nr:hypothetical protein [Ruminococcus sp.]
MEAVLQQEQTCETPKLNNGALWYICLAPAFGLFMERYATSRVVGAAVWIMCVASMIAAEIIDMRILEKGGYDTKRLRPWVFFFPGYIFMRERMVTKEIAKVFICGVFCVIAIAMNGFTQGLIVDGDYLTVSVQNSGISSLDNFNGSSSRVIGDCIASYLGEKAEWSSEKTGDDVWTIKAAGEHDGEKVIVEFEVEHDGYTYKGFRLSGLNVGGEELHDEDFEELAKKIFIDG